MSANNYTRLTGNIGRDPIQNGQMVRFSVCTKERYTDKSGKPASSDQWHDLVAFGETAQQALQLRSGQYVMIEGSHKTNRTTGPDGQDKVYHNIVVSRIWLPMPRAEQSQEYNQEYRSYNQEPKNYQQPAPQRHAPQHPQSYGPSNFPDEVPF